MSLHTRIASKLQTNLPDDIHRKTQSKHTPGSILALTAGVTLALASAATNACYGFYRYDQLPCQLSWAAVSVAASVLLALGPTALLKSVKARSLAGSVLALVAIGLTGSYSFSAAIGASAGQRLTAATAQTDTDATRTRLTTAYRAAKDELGSLPPAPATAAQLDAQISALKQTPGANDCSKIDGPVSKRVCQEASALEVERAKAAHREELQATMAEADKGLKKLGPAKVANTDAVAISGYLAVAGVTIPVDAINRWLALLAVALVEFGGGLAFALSAVLREAVVTSPVTKPKDKTSIPVLEPVDTPQPAKIEAQRAASPALKIVSSQPVQRKRAPDNGFSGRLLALVDERGGTLYSGHRALAKALGCSTAHIGNLLRELTAAGQVLVQPTKSGTVIRLAA